MIKARSQKSDFFTNWKLVQEGIQSGMLRVSKSLFVWQSGTNIFLRLSKVLSIIHHESVGRVHKKCYLMLLLSFLTFFFVFHHNIYVFVIFFFFLWSIRFPKQKINQSETRIGGFQLSVELYGNILNEKLQYINTEGHWRRNNM